MSYYAGGVSCTTMKMYFASGTMTSSYFFVRSRRSFTSSCSSCQHTTRTYNFRPECHTSTSRSCISPPAEFTKLHIIAANSSTPSFTAPFSAAVETAFRVLSRERKDEKDPVVCSMVLRDRSRTMVAFTPAFPDKRAMVSETLEGVALLLFESATFPSQE